MKKWKKSILALLCVSVIFAVTACGTMNDGRDNANTNNTGTEQKDRNNNDVTDGGVIDDMGDAAGNVIDDIGNGVENITDDVTGNGNNNMNR